MPTPDQLDVVAADGEAVVILGSGDIVRQPADLPWEAGVHLVGGTALRGGLRTVAALPEGRAYLSPDYRWLGILEEADGTTLRLYDTTEAARPGFCFQVPAGATKLTLHPSGEMVACREGEDLRLLLPDGQELRSASFPYRKEDWYAEEALLFSPCGGYLWFAATDPQRAASLLLLRCPTLEVLDSCPPPFDPSNPYDSEGTWPEVLATASPATNHVALQRQAGDDFLTLNFYTTRRDRLVLHPHHVYATEDDIPGERVDDVCFAPGGKRFLLSDSDNHLHEFSFPGCEPVDTTNAYYLNPLTDSRHFTTFAYKGKHVLAEVEGELLVLRSGELGRASLLPLGWVREVLANGMVLTGGEGEQKLAEMHLTSRSIPVVAELDSETNRVVKVHHRQRGAWRDITAEVGWVELYFRLEDR